MPPTLRHVRSRQEAVLSKLHPIMVDLESASREALNTWKHFTLAMEKVACLYSRYVDVIPAAATAADVGLDPSVAAPPDTENLLKKFKTTVKKWSLSDAVVDVRAQLFAEWAVWNRMERRLENVEALVEERTQYLRKIRAWQLEVDKLEHSNKKKSADNTVNASRDDVNRLKRDIKDVRALVRVRDADVAEDFAELVKRCLPFSRHGAVKTGSALYNVGNKTAKAFCAYSGGGDDAAADIPDITQTPSMGVPLDMDFSPLLRTQPASPSSADAEYGYGVPYEPAGDIHRETSVGDAHVLFTA